jgi:FixJ family two-component response regulator
VTDKHCLRQVIQSHGFAFRVVQDEASARDLIRHFNALLLLLTQKEKAVLDHVLDGMTNKSISTLLEVTMRTVEMRKASLMRKLKASTHTDLVRKFTQFDTLRNLFRE